VIDQVEERRLRPLQVVEDDDQRLLACQALEDSPGLQRDLVPIGLEVDLQ
jgi:hypothetical protein